MATLFISWLTRQYFEEIFSFEFELNSLRPKMLKYKGCMTSGALSLDGCSSVRLRVLSFLIFFFSVLSCLWEAARFLGDPDNCSPDCLRRDNELSALQKYNVGELPAREPRWTRSSIDRVDWVPCYSLGSVSQQAGQISAPLALQVLLQFDKSMNNALAAKVKAKLTFKVSWRSQPMT